MDRKKIYSVIWIAPATRELKKGMWDANDDRIIDDDLRQGKPDQKNGDSSHLRDEKMRILPKDFIPEQFAGWHTYLQSSAPSSISTMTTNQYQLVLLFTSKTSNLGTFSGSNKNNSNADSTKICTFRKRLTISKPSSISSPFFTRSSKLFFINSNSQSLQIQNDYSSGFPTRNSIKMNDCNIPTYFYWLLYFFSLLAVEAKQLDAIPGCPDLSIIDLSITKSDSYNGGFCFCHIQENGNVSVSCLYGSNLSHFQQTFHAIHATQKTIAQVTFSRVDFENSTLPGKLFEGAQAAIRIISIDKCAQNTPLIIDDEAFYGLAKNLEELYITDCNLEKFPRLAIKHLTKLKRLSLAHNKLTNLEKDDLQPLKQLVTLNLEGNFISYLENETLSMLHKTLTELSFGSHNFVNDSVFDEISQLTELKVLDLNQADGITDVPQGAFRRLEKLMKLFLSGCSLTVIRKNTFQGLRNLRELDLRINLLNEVECGSFLWTPNLRHLSLAGNYLNESRACWWDGLEHLKDLDLGWNEFTALDSETFAKLGATLGALNLRHNKQLIQIEEDAFKGLSNLRRLNLSEISIAELNGTLKQLPSLKELDLSNGKLKRIDSSDVEIQGETLERLLLRGNQLKNLSRDVLENLKNLRELDLSDNPWLCDENIEPMTEEIELKYKEAVLQERNFILLNVNETICNRPNSLKGQVITNIITDSFKSYSSGEDDVESFTVISTTENDINFQDINASAITELLAKGVFIGDDSAKTESHQIKAEPIRPLYDINMKNELVDETNRTQSTPAIVAVVALMLVSISVIAATVQHLRAKTKDGKSSKANQSRNEQQKNNKWHETPRTSPNYSN